MIVSEIFHSIQGEGPTAGMPALFVRLGLCNLHCTFCDTPYTWKAGQEDYSALANEHIVESIVLILQEFPHTNVVVWTGGEPMLQQREIVAAIDYLNARCSNRSLQHEVETNGTIDALPEFDARIHRYNCSPKTEMSGNDAYTVRLRNFSKTTYKYVVGTEKHCREALGEIDRQHLPRERCSFMVLGATSADMAEHGRVVAKVCMREGIRLCIRLQSILWESKRGT